MAAAAGVFGLGDRGGGDGDGDLPGDAARPVIIAGGARMVLDGDGAAPGSSTMTRQRACGSRQR